MIKPRNLLLLLPLLTLVTAPLWSPPLSTFLRSGGVVESAGPAPAPARTFSMENVNFTQSQAGRLEWRIDAARLHTAAGETDLHMEDVRAVFLEAAAKPANSPRQTTIVSSRADYDTMEKALLLADGVILTFGREYVLRTEKLRYLAEIRQIKTKAAVRLDGPNLAIKGKGLTYDLASGAYDIMGPVSCQVW